MRSFPTCAHEAGHAAAYLVHGADRAQVIEVTSDGETGLCRARWRGLGPTDMAVVHLAGFAAEQRALYGPGRRASAFRDLADTADIAGAADALGTDDAERMLVAWNDAALLVDVHWHRIERAARVLQRTGRLSGEEIARLWQACSPL